MIDFSASDLVVAAWQVQDLITLYAEDNAAQQSAEFEKVLHNLEIQARRLDWQQLAEQASRLRKRLASPPFDFDVTSLAVSELVASIQWNLKQDLFIAINGKAKRYYEQKEPLFGAKVQDAFPTAAREIAEAGRCFSFERWTACVFHLMRATERALIALANDLSVPFKIPFEYENWQNILEPIESKIREIKNLPKGQEKTNRLQFYSDAAVQFRYIKDAWRNHVAHSRDTYDENEAMRIMDHVSSFMRELAEGGLRE